ncbi:RNA-directed DNA polymerase [Novosphingobium sp. FKTRR1]|uniref:RNA-directed DNA polymerase n=1 Tax=Novosphingobium sp. FKTRR1 TaxID=2879118 RepID=UPI001CEFE7FF|nr:RNA-directed DNA polymerase [Novosphingobium sp. FKTRR1]
MDLFAGLGATAPALEQADFFRADKLTQLFHEKISQSQAAGKDGIRGPRYLEMLESEIPLIERKIFDGTYKFTCFKERLIARGHDRNPRQISIPTVRDRLVLRSICDVLHNFAKYSLNNTPHVLVDQVAKLAKLSDDDTSFVRLDVRDFFPSIRHNLLERALRGAGLSDLVVDLCMRAVRTATGSSMAAPEIGIPQGLSISNALSQIYMASLDSGKSAKSLNYFRYVDDILCITKTHEAKKALNSLSRSLSRKGLRVHREGKSGKTEIKSLQEGIDFLGYRIEKNNLSIRKSSYDRMFKNILKIVTEYKYSKEYDRSLYKLNLKITGCIFDERKRGWMMFFSRTENISQLRALDIFVKNQMLKAGFPKKGISNLKSFVKSYHEIRYNLNETKYIPNFMKFTDDEKIEAICALSNNLKEIVATWNPESIDAEFKKLIAREVSDLEKDIGGIS